MGLLIHSHQWDRRGCSLFLLTLVRARGASIIPKVLHKRLFLHRWAREARVWVEVKDRAYRPGIWRPRSVSTLLSAN